MTLDLDAVAQRHEIDRGRLEAERRKLALPALRGDKYASRRLREVEEELAGLDRIADRTRLAAEALEEERAQRRERDAAARRRRSVLRLTSAAQDERRALADLRLAAADLVEPLKTATTALAAVIGLQTELREQTGTRPALVERLLKDLARTIEITKLLDPVPIPPAPSGTTERDGLILHAREYAPPPLIQPEADTREAHPLEVRMSPEEDAGASPRLPGPE